MKRILFIVAFALASQVHAQQFVSSFEVALPDSVTRPEVKWTDFDNDGLLDLLVLGFGGQSLNLFVYKSDTVTGFHYENHFTTTFTSAAWHVQDVDLDNDIDVVLSGVSAGADLTGFLINDGAFAFHAESSIQQKGSVIGFADLTRDGRNEIILADDVVRIFRRDGNGWVLHSDTIEIEASAIEVFDVDGDGDNDMFIAGKRGITPATEIFFQGIDQIFTVSKHNQPINGNAVVADVNVDGSLDVVTSGTIANGTHVNRVYRNQAGVFIARDTIFQDEAEVFAADLNSDGSCDLHFLSNQYNRVLFTDLSHADIPMQGLLEQEFGDFDRDGNLDVIQVVDANGIRTARLLKNTAVKNNAPNLPSNLVGFSIYDKLFLYWDKPDDDHTPVDAITYDVMLQIESQEVMIGNFDLISKKRMVVEHGNNGTKNFALLNINSSSFQFSVQAVDNAFHGGAVGNCIGGLPSCSELISEAITVCKDQPISFPASASSLWFSTKRGLIGKGALLDEVAEETDTIFSFTLGEGGCASIHVYSIKFGSGVIEKSVSEKFVCEGEVVPFTAEADWSSVTWSSYKKGFLSNADEINFAATEPDTVKVLLSDGSGCFVQRSVSLKISRPALELNGSAFQILRGESVQLSASGAEHYSWTPSESLDDPNSPTPIATPFSSTQYVVTGTDSIGCTAQASVLIMVEGTAFIPTLFTPNADGQNDNVKIYGMPEVKSFKFTIHNREGATVYTTEDPAQAFLVGWDGTARGVPQPNGIYYWKVKGEQMSGARMLLNGKTTGSIVLIR